MNCVNCYHYEACKSVDVTGYVTDRDKTPEDDLCEHFLNPEDVRPTAHWVRKVYKNSWSNKVNVCYECSRCDGRSERVYTTEFIDKQLWDDYLHAHWMPRNDPHDFCPKCGAEMNLDKTEHANLVIEDK